MGQKVNPHGLRVGVIADWNTTWYADKKEFSKFLKEDNVIRTFLKKKYYAAAISKRKHRTVVQALISRCFISRPPCCAGYVCGHSWRYEISTCIDFLPARLKAPGICAKMMLQASAKENESWACTTRLSEPCCSQFCTSGIRNTLSRWEMSPACFLRTTSA